MKPIFIATSLAGDRIGGIRNPGIGKEIDLTESQAEHPLRLGYVVRKKLDAPKPHHEGLGKKSQRGKN